MLIWVFQQCRATLLGGAPFSVSYVFCRPEDAACHAVAATGHAEL